MSEFIASFLFSFIFPYLLYLIFFQSKYDLIFNCSLEHKFFMPLVSALVLGLIFILNRKYFRNLIFRLGLGLISGSGLYNIGTRILSGCVPDYINFFNISVINIADVLIFVGLAMVIFSIFKYNGSEGR